MGGVTDHQFGGMFGLGCEPESRDLKSQTTEKQGIAAQIRPIKVNRAIVKNMFRLSNSRGDLGGGSQKLDSVLSSDSPWPGKFMGTVYF